MARRFLLIVLSLLLLPVVVAGGAVAWLAVFPDTLRAPLARLLTAQLGREVRIDGPLQVELGRVTTVDLRGLHVAAPDWARADDLAAVERLRLGVDLMGFLRDRTIHVTELRVETPRLVLERDAQGRTSWPASEGNGGGGASGEAVLPRIDSLTVQSGQLAYLDAIGDVSAEAGIATTTPQDGSPASLQIDGTGTVKSDLMTFALQVRSPTSIASGGSPLPIKGELTLAGTRLAVDGELREPAAFGGLTLDVDLASDDPRGLLALAGHTSDTALPPLAVTGRLSRERQVIALDGLRASWGDSAVEGRASFDPAVAPKRISVELHAPRLDLVQLQDALAGKAETRSEAPAAGNPLAVLVGYTGEIRVTAEAIRLPPNLELKELQATLRLADDRLEIAGLRIGLPQGRLAGDLTTGPLSAPDLTLDTKLEATAVGLGGLAGEGYGGQVDGRLAGTIRFGPIATMLAQSRLRLEGHGDDLSVPQAELGSVALTAELVDGRLRLDPLRATLPQGEISGRVEAGPFDDGFTADLDLDAKGVDLGAAARTEAVAGRLDGRLTGKLAGSTVEQLLTRSRLELNGAIDGLRLPQLERRISRATLSVTLDPDRAEALRFVVEARAGDRPLKLTGFGGSAAAIAKNSGDYPFTVEAQLGNNNAKVNGTVSLPLTERKFGATVELEGPDPSPILALFELPKLQIPPYRVSGVLTNRGDELRIKDLDGRVGDSDVAADLTVSFDGERPKIVGAVRSKVLDADDLGGLVGAQPGTGPGETASPGQEAEAVGKERTGTVLPDELIDPSRWRKVDADLDLRADEIHAGKIPLDGFNGHLAMVDGLMRLDPLELRVGEGRVTGRIAVDGRREPVRSDVALDMQRVSVARLLRRLDVDVASFGTLSGTARGGVGLGGAGISIKDILAHSDGDIRLVMEGGRIDRTIVAGLGLDLLRLFGSFVGATPDTVELRCTVADLEVRDGIVATRPLIIDTEIADLGGEGVIDLKSETIDISLTARPKSTPLPTDLTGISITGTLAEPRLDINPLALAARGVAAATLGVLLKPFTALADATAGQAQTPCAALLDSAPGEAGGG